MHFKCEMPFKIHKLIFFSRKKSMSLPYLKFSDQLSETHLLLYLALVRISGKNIFSDGSVGLLLNFNLYR